MAVDPKLLFRHASLTKADRDALYEATHRYEGLAVLDEARLREVTTQAADDRVSFAERRAAFATAMPKGLPGDEEMAQREALIVAYDAIHHALRALNIGFHGWDPVEHDETAKAAGELLAENRDLGPRFDWLKLGRPLQDAVADLRTERQAAEWDVTNRDAEGKARIDYADRSKAAVHLADGVVRTVRAALTDLRTGVLKAP